MSERYQITKLLEKDQLGSVYLAQDTTLQRPVVYRSFEAGKSDVSPEGFSQYTGKLCALQHPNMLTIYDIAHRDKGYFMVTQFLEGESLASRLSQGALSYVGVHNMACDLLDALHAAHTSGLYHGALRTDSVIRLPRVRGGHRYLIVDFGLDRISAMICGTHVIMADPVLMAPEIVGYKQEPDSRSDLFTLGQLCYIALVGGHPYAGKSPEECAQAYRDGGLPHLSTYVQGVQPEVANWVMWLVSGDPERRPASSQEAMEVLHSIKLVAPAPNVPGVTQAVEVPEEPERNKPKITESVKVSGESVPKKKKAKKKPAKKTGKKSEKKTGKGAAGASKERPVHMSKEAKLLVGSLGLVIVLLVILVLVLVFRDEEPKISGVGGASGSEQTVKMVTMQKLQYFDQLASRSKPVYIRFDGSKTIDWTVITGVPASSARLLMKEGNYIRNIVALGGYKEFISDEMPVEYRAGGKKITPQRGVTGGKMGNAKSGDGWQVDLRVPEKHSGGLVVTLFLIQNQCDFSIEVRSTNKENEGKVVKMNVRTRTPGVVRVPLNIEDPKPGYYSIRILAEAPNLTTDFEMGLSAVLLERV